MLTESQGRVLLKQAFNAKGYNITEDYPMTVAGQVLHLDGYDPAARVGYEYITDEDGRSEFSEEVIAELDSLMSRGECFLLLIDEGEASTEADLAEATEHFLNRSQAQR